MNWREWRHLLYSKMKFCERIWHMLINYLKSHRCKRNENKGYQRTCSSIFVYDMDITWVNEGTEFAGEFKKVCGTQGIQNYSTMISTKAAFAEGTTYNTILGNRSSPLHGRSWIQVHWHIVSIRQNSDFQKKIVRWTWYQKMSRIPTFCPFCTVSHYENLENPSLRMKTEFAYRIWLTLQAGL